MNVFCTFPHLLSHTQTIIFFTDPPCVGLHYLKTGKYIIMNFERILVPSAESLENLNCNKNQGILVSVNPPGSPFGGRKQLRKLL